MWEIREEDVVEMLSDPLSLSGLGNSKFDELEVLSEPLTNDLGWRELRHVLGPPLSALARVAVREADDVLGPRERHREAEPRTPNMGRQLLVGKASEVIIGFAVLGSAECGPVDVGEPAGQRQDPVCIGQEFHLDAHERASLRPTLASRRRS